MPPEKNGGQKLCFSIKKAKNILSRSYHYILSGIMVCMYSQTDKLMIKQMINETIEKKKIEPLFKETYGYDIPVATLSYLLDVLKKQDKIDYLKHEIIEIGCVLSKLVEV